MVPPIAGTEYILVSKRSVQRLLSAVCSAGDCAILDLQPPELGPPAGGPSFREFLSSPRGFIAVRVSAEGKTATDGAHGMAR